MQKPFLVLNSMRNYRRRRFYWLALEGLDVNYVRTLTCFYATTSFNAMNPVKNIVLTGFGKITLLDLDTIDLSNLNRQFLFRKKDVKQSKALVSRPPLEGIST